MAMAVVIDWRRCVLMLSGRDITFAVMLRLTVE